jgi:hypothetical protein
MKMLRSWRSPRLLRIAIALLRSHPWKKGNGGHPPFPPVSFCTSPPVRSMVAWLNRRYVNRVHFHLWMVASHGREELP